MEQTWPKTIKRDDSLKYPGEFGARIAAADAMHEANVQYVRGLGKLYNRDFSPRWRDREAEIQQLVNLYNKVNGLSLTYEQIMQREAKLIAEREIVESTPAAR